MSLKVLNIVSKNMMVTVTPVAIVATAPRVVTTQDLRLTMHSQSLNEMDFIILSRLIPNSTLG